MANAAVEIKVPADIEYRVIGNAFGLMIACGGLLGRMMVLAPKLALELGCRPYPEGGFRIIANTGADGAQEVHHLHLHVMGGLRPWARG